MIVQQCVESWKKLNTEWDVRLLDKNGVGDYIQLDLSEEKLSTLVLAHKSDLIRLKLLEVYGGVWADATTYCMQPLDMWIEEASRSGFFAFDRPGPGRLLSNWFLAAEKQNRIIVRWYALLTNFWAENKFQRPGPVRQRIVRRIGRYLNGDCSKTKYWFSPLVTKVLKVYPYPVMHYLFERLMAKDEACRTLWGKTMKISADGPHALQFAGLLSPLTEKNRRLVAENNFSAEKYPSSLLWYLFEGRFQDKS